MVRHWSRWDEGKRSHLFVADARTGEAKDLTPKLKVNTPPAPFGGSDDYDFAPDGRELAFTAEPARDAAWSTNTDIWIVDPDGSVPAPIVTSAVYEVAIGSKYANKPLSMTDALGRTTTWTYAPEHGGVLSETGPAVNGVAPQKRYAYVQRYARLLDGSPAGPPVWLLERMSTCRIGNPSGFGCELGSDEVLTIYDYGPDNAPTNLLLRGQAVVADGEVLRTCFAYDGRGRKISETSPNGTAGLSACPAAAPTSALPWTSSTRYDADGRVTGTIAPDPDGSGPLPHPAVRNSYDQAGRLVRVEQGTLAAWQPDGVAPAAWPGFVPLKWADTAYDALDRKVRESAGAPGGTASVTEYSYDLAGRLKCTAVRMNLMLAPPEDKCAPAPVPGPHGADRVSKNVYDTAGRLTESWDGVGTPLQRREALYTYNANGQKTSLTDARGFKAELTYDGFGRQQRWVFPSKTTPGVADQADYEQYLYDPNGNRISLRKRDGRVLAYDYDALNRMVRKSVPPSASGAAGYNVFYGYDLRGLQTRAAFDGLAGAGTGNAYDAFGRLTSSTMTMGGVSRTLRHLYNRDSRESELTFPTATSSGRAATGSAGPPASTRARSARRRPGSLRSPGIRPRSSPA